MLWLKYEVKVNECTFLYCFDVTTSGTGRQSGQSGKNLCKNNFEKFTGRKGTSQLPTQSWKMWVGMENQLTFRGVTHVVPVVAWI